MTALSPLRMFPWIWCLAFALAGPGLRAQTNAPAPGTNINDAVLLTVSGTVDVAPPGSTAWKAGTANQVLHVGDQLRTGKASRASMRLSDKSIVRLYELTTITVKPPAAARHNDVLELKSGSAYIFNRDKPDETQFQTPSASGAIRGTEFNLVVREDGRTELTLLDGQVDLTNAQGTLELQSGEQATVTPGQAPQKTAVLNAVNVIQWTLYYPAVLDADELELSADLPTTLAPSLEAYRSGDLLAALARYPADRVATTGAERAYHAALLLAVGEVEQAQAQLRDAVSEARPAVLAAALQEMIATVKGEAPTNTPARTLATEWLADSYAAQAHGDLVRALALARSAVAAAPNFGFAGERVAELEFGFGHTQAALDALSKSLTAAPRNAQALALQGFLFSAQNKISTAISWFDRAIAVDGGLGNAWLGRGLSRIHAGHGEEGFRDLLMAAALEPRRSLLRSYLGKAFSDIGDDAHANKELKLARDLDPNDPTTWLYSALLKQQENRINEAVGDLDASQEKNDNRSVFRSRLLLDEDRAVGSANLASIYRDLGMTDVSLREASRSVTEDYANASAHLFLADSYYNLLDPTQFNLRYDTVQANEQLLANILSPVGGGRLSQSVSQQDYSKLFTSDGVGAASSTEVRTDGMLHQQASQFGTYGDTSYALDLDYHHNDGVRVNNGLDNIFWTTTIKQQVTPKDTAMLIVQYEDYTSGDNFQYYYQTNARPFYKFTELQQPELVGTWHHEWAPGIHTLLLLGRLVDTQTFSDRASGVNLNIFFENGAGNVYAVSPVPFNVNYQENFEIYTAEVNQIFETERATLNAGARFQSGTFDTQNLLSTTSPLSTNTNPLLRVIQPSVNASTTGLFQRETAYAYLTVKPLDNLWLTGGATADHETFPSDFRQPPIGSGEDTRVQLGPKAALVWNLLPELTWRGIYTRSLGGVSLDESYRLEPTQLAGFPQAFRSLISESIVGSQSAPTFETLGTALDFKLGSRTFAGIQIERLRSNVRESIGEFDAVRGATPAVVSSTEEQLNYREDTFGLSVNHLIGDGLVLGADYKITQSDLHYVYPSVSILNQSQSAHLQQADGYALFNHSSGFFAKAEVHWYGQSDTPLAGSAPEPRVSFFQENIYAGYRFAHRRVELQCGILNLAGGDYHLDPLTVYQELPRKRVFDVMLNFIF